MQDTKFTMNAFLLVVIILSAVFFFFTVKVVALSDHSAINDFYPVEGTGLAVRYSSLVPNGIYEGDKANGILRLEGDFGYDWGIALQGNSLFVNEYSTTSLGIMLCNVVKVDTSSFEKQLLWRNAILRGRCASGELVCVRGCMMPVNFPQTNSLCRLYALSDPQLDPAGGSAEVLFLDPETGAVLYRVSDADALTGDFEALYLARTLREVMG